MKKLVSIITIAVSATLSIADDYSDLIRLKELSDMAQSESERYIGLIFQRVLNTSPDIFIRAATADPNTYMWYLWKEFSESDGFKKLEAFQTIEQLNK